MPLIDKTYFVGELNIPNTNNEYVAERLDAFIGKYEDKFLTDLLGYDLKAQFITGLKQSPILSIWTNILFGSSYTYNNTGYQWKGLINLPDGVTATIDTSNTIEMVVGRGQANDPASDGATVTIPSSFVGVPVVLNRRGYGQMTGSEYTINGNVLTLVGSIFNAGETFFLSKGTTLGISLVASARPTSIIANYVYYWWQRNEVTQSSGIGEVSPNTENSNKVSPGTKMARAWNEMVEQVWELVSYLDASVSVYPNWLELYNYARLNDIFSPINTMNL